MSSSGYLTGHDPTHRDLMDPGSLDLEYLIIYVSTCYTSPPTYMPMHAWSHTTYVVLYRRTCAVCHIPHPTLSLSPLPGSRDLGPLWISWLSDPTSPDLVIPRILDPVSLHLTYPTSATSRNAALRVCCTTPLACTCMLLRCIPGVAVGYMYLRSTMAPGHPGCPWDHDTTICVSGICQTPDPPSGI